MTLAPDQALLLAARDAARLCGVSERTWRTWDAGGRVPRAVEIGRSKFWRRRELEEWIGQGCPDRHAWQTMSSGERS
jgi:predicted DNA-binding transcriptional regulator AlpA